MHPTVTGEQPRTRADVRAGKFEIAAPLRGLVAGSALGDVSSIAVPFELRFRDVGDDVIFESAGVSQVAAAAVGAFVGVDLVLDERSIGRWLEAERAGVSAMLGPSPIVGRALLGRLFGCVLFASLEELLELAFEFGDAFSQLGVLGFEFSKAAVARVCLLYTSPSPRDS